MATGRSESYFKIQNLKHLHGRLRDMQEARTVRATWTTTWPRQAVLSGRGFKMEQGVQRRPFVRFGLQQMHHRLLGCDGFLHRY